MKPTDGILFSSRACWIRTALIVGGALLIGAACFAPLGMCVFLPMTLLLAGILGCIFAYTSSRTAAHRLMDRYPNRAEDIMARRKYPRRINPVMRKDELMDIVENDPQAETMLLEMQTLHTFAEAWIDIPWLAYFLCVAIQVA